MEVRARSLIWILSLVLSLLAVIWVLTSTVDDWALITRGETGKATLLEVQKTGDGRVEAVYGVLMSGATTSTQGTEPGTALMTTRTIKIPYDRASDVPGKNVEIEFLPENPQVNRVNAGEWKVWLVWKYLLVFAWFVGSAWFVIREFRRD